MNGKQLRFAAVALCLLALITVSATWAEVHRTPLQGTLSPLVTTEIPTVTFSTVRQSRASEAIPGNLYDNIPTALAELAPG